jgi:ankyrin repeat protein
MKLFNTMNLMNKSFILLFFGLGSLGFLASAQAANPADWWISIANDRVDSVKTFLADGANPNERNTKGQPAIMQAMRDGAWRTYDVLAANRHTHVNEVNISNETPLMYLALLGQTQRAEVLIKHGAEVNRLGWTPLHYAASTGKAETARMLIAHKAIVDAPAPDGTTPLMMAAYAGSEPTVKLLLDAGAEVTAQNLNKEDAADWARKKGYGSLAQEIDALIQNTLKQRAAQRAKNRAEQGEVDGQAAGAVPNTPQGNPDTPAANPAPAPAASPDAKKAETDNSTSNYFDLGRFDKNAAH